MKIIISNHSEYPIYQQICSQIEEQIVAGSIAEGTTLPSIRGLAKELGVSVITTTRAYNELETNGYIVTRQGKGSIVLRRDNSVLLEQYKKHMDEAMTVVIENGKYLDMTDEQIMKRMEERLKDECN